MLDRRCQPSDAPEFTEGWYDGRARDGDRGDDAAGGDPGGGGDRSTEVGTRDNWLLWIDLATPLPPWNVPEEFLAPYFTEEPIEDEEEGAEVEAVESEPLTPVMDPATGPIDPDDDPLYLSVQTSYAAAVTYLDAGVGQLLEALDNLEGGDGIAARVHKRCRPEPRRARRDRTGSRLAAR